MKFSSFRNFGVISAIALFVAGMALGLVIFVLYYSFAGLKVFIVVGVNLLILAAIYIVLNYIYKTSSLKASETVVKELDGIDMSGTRVTANTLPGEELPGARDTYKAITRLKKRIAAKEKTRRETLDLVNSAASSMELDKLLETIMPMLIESTKSSWGAFYLSNPTTDKLEIQSSIGFNKHMYTEFDISLGEGFFEHVPLSGLKDILIINDMPDDTVFVSRTFLGKIKPKSVMVVPVANQGQLMGVLALAGLFPYESTQKELMEMIRFYIGAAVSAGVIFERTKRLSNELQFQNKLIQDMNNELEMTISARASVTGQILDNIQDCAVFTLDGDGLISLWNAGAERIYGYAAGEMLGRPGTAACGGGGEREAAFRRDAEAAYADGAHTRRSRMTNPGGDIYAEIAVYALRGEDGQPNGCAFIVRDITELHDLREALRVETAVRENVIKESRQAFLLLDDDFKIELWNDPARRLLNADGGGTGMDFAGFFEEAGGVLRYITDGDLSKTRDYRLISGIETRLCATAIYGEDGQRVKTVVLLERDNANAGV